MVRPLSLDTDRSLDGAERLSRSRLVQGVPALGRCDFNALIRNGKADFPLVRLKWRCGNSRSALLADLGRCCGLNVVAISPVAGAFDDIGLPARQAAFGAPLRVAKRRPEATQPGQRARKHSRSEAARVTGACSLPCSSRGPKPYLRRKFRPSSPLRKISSRPHSRMMATAGRPSAEPYRPRLNGCGASKPETMQRRRR
jgi:hypothetical protein